MTPNIMCHYTRRTLDLRLLATFNEIKAGAKKEDVDKFFADCKNFLVESIFQILARFDITVDYSVRMGWEVISIQNGGGMLTSSIRRAYGVRTKVGRLRKNSVLKSD